MPNMFVDIYQNSDLHEIHPWVGIVLAGIVVATPTPQSSKPRGNPICHNSSLCRGNSKAWTVGSDKEFIAVFYSLVFLGTISRDWILLERNIHGLEEYACHLEDPEEQFHNFTTTTNELNGSYFGTTNDFVYANLEAVFLSIEDDEEEEMVFPNDVVTKTGLNYLLCLVGRLIMKKTIRVHIMKERMAMV
ncbi:hypothetical protein JHK85_012503 [Glycine max]|nr:hypothetical protein JHK85_012503 [Glycine max]KAG5057175.1 hypothetical protein JHK86_012171 [Glycine max]